MRRAARQFPVIMLTGPRRAGKTTLLQRAFAGASYRLLEDPEVLARVRSDPRMILDELRLPAGHRRLLLVEAKSTRTVLPRMAGPGMKLAAAARGHRSEVLVVHRTGPDAPATRAIAEGAQALTLDQLLKRVEGRA